MSFSDRATTIFLNKLNLVNNHLVLIVIYIALSFLLALMQIKGYFDGITQSVNEKALIDGASRSNIVRKINLKVAFPGLVFVSLVIMVALWGNVLFHSILLSNAKKFPILLLLLICPVYLKQLHSLSCYGLYY
jgi:ABC-type maltose transport system permease subunit